MSPADDPSDAASSSLIPASMPVHKKSSGRKTPRGTPLGERSRSRLAAIQAVFQIEASSLAAAEVTQQFLDPRGTIGLRDEHGIPAQIDRVFFVRIVNGVDTDRAVLDDMITASLSEGWTLARIDSVARAILRCGLYELLRERDVPPKVAINEYLTLAHSFFDDPDVAFINSILDKAAKTLNRVES